MKITRRQLRQMIMEAYNAAYEVDKYLPGLKRAVEPLKGYAQEIQKSDWGKDTALIHREMEDAMSSLNLVIAALEEAQVEYQKGPMGGNLKPQSQMRDPESGEYLSQPSYGIE